MTDMTDTVRLAKRLADQLSCSRREAENYVLGGWVEVDGQVNEVPGARVSPQVDITLRPGARAEPVEPVTLLLNKPSGWGASEGNGSAATLFVAENHMPDPDPRVRVLQAHLANLVLATPLEAEASGLVVVTQQHGIMRKLMDEADRVEQEFVVGVSGAMAEDGLARLNRGATWQGKPLPAIKVSWQNESHLRFALKTPPLGLIRHLCEQVGLTVVSMRRIRIGRLSMSSLPSGQWRYLKGYERF